MYTLVFAKVEGGIGDAETILTVLQAHLLTIIEHRLDGSALCGTYHLVMNLQMTELQGDIPECINICRIKHGDTIGTAEHQTAIRQLTRGTIGKLIASQSVGLRVEFYSNHSKHRSYQHSPQTSRAHSRVSTPWGCSYPDSSWYSRNHPHTRRCPACHGHDRLSTGQTRL